MDVKLVSAPIEIEFEEDFGGVEFRRDFDKFAESDEDPVGHWLRMSRAKGDTVDSDKVLLTLLVELHRKVDQIQFKLNGKKNEKEFLKTSAMIESIHYEYFRIEDEVLENSKRYYGRIHMPTFPKREVPVFFEAVSQKDAKIIHMHDRDVKEWDAYVASRERVMIRKMKDGVDNG